VSIALISMLSQTGGDQAEVETQGFRKRDVMLLHNYTVACSRAQAAWSLVEERHTRPVRTVLFGRGWPLGPPPPTFIEGWNP
jgi:hypothetical protein